MKGMDEGSLRSMMLSTGMCQSEEAAEAMARGMKGMSDAQMKWMVRAVATLQAVAVKAQRTKEWVLRNKMLVLSIVVVLVALLLSTLRLI